MHLPTWQTRKLQQMTFIYWTQADSICKLIILLILFKMMTLIVKKLNSLFKSMQWFESLPFVKARIFFSFEKVDNLLLSSFIFCEFKIMICNTNLKQSAIEIMHEYKVIWIVYSYQCNNFKKLSFVKIINLFPLSLNILKIMIYNTNLKQNAIAMYEYTII